MMKSFDKNDPLFWSIYDRVKLSTNEDRNGKIWLKISTYKHFITIYKSIFNAVWIVVENADNGAPLEVMRA